MLEDAAQRINTGLSFNEQVIATLDVNEFLLFMPALLPGRKSPVVIVFNPQKQLFYTKRVRYEKKFFYDDSLGLINDYFEDKLSPYPYKSSYKLYLFGVLCFVILGYFVSRFSKKRNVLKHE